MRQKLKPLERDTVRTLRIPLLTPRSRKVSISAAFDRTLIYHKVCINCKIRRGCNAMRIPSSTGRMFPTSLIGKAHPSYRMRWGTGRTGHEKFPLCQECCLSFATMFLQFCSGWNPDRADTLTHKTCWELISHEKTQQSLHCVSNFGISKREDALRNTLQSA